MANYSCDLKTGDVLLYRHRSLIGWLITLFTGGEMSHAGIVIADGERHYVLDATLPHVDVRPVSVDVADGCSIKVLRAPECIHWAPNRLSNFAYAIEGTTHYATCRMLACAWTEIFGVPDGLLDPDEIPKRFMCSELVSRCCRMFSWWEIADDSISYDPCPDRPDRYTTPRDLNDSSLVTVCEKLAFAETASG